MEEGRERERERERERNKETNSDDEEEAFLPHSLRLLARSGPPFWRAQPTLLQPRHFLSPHIWLSSHHAMHHSQSVSGGGALLDLNGISSNKFQQLES